MRLVKKISSLFIPYSGNNHKAKLLKTPSILLLAFLVMSLQVVIKKLPSLGINILGYASNISVPDVVRLTNEKRAEAGLSPLTYNETLSAAALSKGNDMLAKDYWAHVAPDGTEPWKFFKDVGYKYRYAGENLARDFSNAPSAVEAWMASSSHRENILSPRYSEIGIAVVEGDLSGTDTTIIVQLFGARADSMPAVPIAQANEAKTKVLSPEATPQLQPISMPESKNEVMLIATTSPGVLVSPFNTVRGITLTIVAVMLVVLAIDGVIISRKRIARIAGKTAAHIAFFGMILVILMILKAGRIL